MKRIVLAFILMTVSIVLSNAEPLFQGKFSLNGTMGTGITFRIDAQYMGKFPCVVVGETTYFRKNGKQSHIKIYGTMDDEHCSLYEYVGNRVCGHFEIVNMPSPEQLKNFDQYQGKIIEGTWDNNGTFHDFNQVTLEQNPTAKYNFLKTAKPDPKYISGDYGYRRVIGSSETKYDLRIVVAQDSINWTFNYEDEELGESGEVTQVTPSFGRIAGLSEDFLSFRFPECEYILYPLDDVILITLNDGPEEGDIYNLSGLFPRISDYGYSYEQRQCSKEEPDQVSYALCEIFAPRTDNRVLNDSICAWIVGQAGASANKDYFKLAESATSTFLVEEFDKASLDDDNDIKPIVSDETHISFNCYEQRGYINLTYFGSTYMGGAHGMHGFTHETLRRSDGKVMNWQDWFVDPNKVRPIIEKYMREQNPLVEFEPERLPLPMSAPYFTPGVFHFIYQLYEVCSYAEGMPECEIPLSKLQPYMTQAAKNMVK